MESLVSRKLKLMEKVNTFLDKTDSQRKEYGIYGTLQSIKSSYKKELDDIRTNARCIDPSVILKLNFSEEKKDDGLSILQRTQKKLSQLKGENSICKLQQLTESIRKQNTGVKEFNIEKENLALKDCKEEIVKKIDFNDSNNLSSNVQNSSQMKSNPFAPSNLVNYDNGSNTQKNTNAQDESIAIESKINAIYNEIDSETSNASKKYSSSMDIEESNYVKEPANEEFDRMDLEIIENKNVDAKSEQEKQIVTEQKCEPEPQPQLEVVLRTDSIISNISKLKVDPNDVNINDPEDSALHQSFTEIQQVRPISTKPLVCTIYNGKEWPSVQSSYIVNSEYQESFASENYNSPNDHIMQYAKVNFIHRRNALPKITPQIPMICDSPYKECEIQEAFYQQQEMIQMPCIQILEIEPEQIVEIKELDTTHMLEEKMDVEVQNETEQVVMNNDLTTENHNSDEMLIENNTISAYEIKKEVINEIYDKNLQDQINSQTERSVDQKEESMKANIEPECKELDITNQEMDQVIVNETLEEQVDQEIPQTDKLFKEQEQDQNTNIEESNQEHLIDECNDYNECQNESVVDETKFDQYDQEHHQEVDNLEQHQELENQEEQLADNTSNHNMEEIEQQNLEEEIQEDKQFENQDFNVDLDNLSQKENSEIIETEIEKNDIEISENKEAVCEENLNENDKQIEPKSVNGSNIKDLQKRALMDLDSATKIDRSLSSKKGTEPSKVFCQKTIKPPVSSLYNKSRVGVPNSTVSNLANRSLSAKSITTPASKTLSNKPLTSVSNLHKKLPDTTSKSVLTKRPGIPTFSKPLTSNIPGKTSVMSKSPAPTIGLNAGKTSIVNKAPTLNTGLNAGKTSTLYKAPTLNTGLNAGKISTVNKAPTLSTGLNAGKISTVSKAPTLSTGLNTGKISTAYKAPTLNTGKTSVISKAPTINTGLNQGKVSIVKRPAIPTFSNNTSSSVDKKPGVAKFTPQTTTFKKPLVTTNAPANTVPVKKPAVPTFSKPVTNGQTVPVKKPAVPKFGSLLEKRNPDQKSNTEDAAKKILKKQDVIKYFE